MTDRLEHGTSLDAAVKDARERLFSSESSASNSPAVASSGNGSAMDELDREVREAMSGMAPRDLAELSGHVPMDAGRDGFEPGTEMIGTVVSVSNDDVFLEFGPKVQAIVPRSHFGKKENIEIGRRVDVIIDRYDQEAGLWLVSRKGAAQRATWTNLQAGMLVEGRATGVIKGGLEIDLKGIRAFMPASHADIAPMKDISLLLNQVLRCEVLEVDRRHKNVLLSRRKVQEKEREEAKQRLKSELEQGQVRAGVVKTLVDYGAFIDLGGIDGLLHIKDLSWRMVEKVSDVLTPGQQVQVMILKIDKERDRISLGLKQAQPDPWTQVADRYHAGDSLKARVVRLADFGAFAELESGVEGLIPVSEMSWSRIRKPSDAVVVGDMVDCVILRVEADRRRIALSMKQAQADPWQVVFDSYPVQSMVKGRVTRLADFGAFVELAPGVEGLIHISELADRHVKHCGEVVQPGQEIEPRVIGIDRENRRIALSLKPVHEAGEIDFDHAPEPDHKKKKQRKKPLRGGLASHFDW
jgi:small subunit ribosomal protein S1